MNLKRGIGQKKVRPFDVIFLLKIYIVSFIPKRAIFISNDLESEEAIKNQSVNLMAQSVHKLDVKKNN